MSADELSYTWPCRLRIRLERAEGLTDSDYEQVARLLPSKIPLGDLSSSGLLLDTRTFPMGCILPAYTTSDDRSTALHDFEPWRQTHLTLVIGKHVAAGLTVASEVRGAVCEFMNEHFKTADARLRALDALPQLSSPLPRPTLSRAQSRPTTPVQKTVSQTGARPQGRARVGKAVADVYATYGFVSEAARRYVEVLPVLRTANDYLWIASATEGLARAVVLLNELGVAHAHGQVEGLHMDAIGSYERSLSSTEPVPGLVYGMAFLRFAHWRRKRNRLEVAEWITKGNIVARGLSVADKCVLLSICAYLYNAIRFNRKAAACQQELLLSLTPELISRRAEAARRTGMHPSAAALLGMTDVVPVREFARVCMPLGRQEYRMEGDLAEQSYQLELLLAEALSEFDRAAALVSRRLSPDLDSERQTAMRAHLSRLATTARKLEQPLAVPFWGKLVEDVRFGPCVAGEPAEIAVTLRNAFVFEVEVADFLLEGLNVDLPVRTLLPPQSHRTILLSFLPVEGQLRVSHCLVTVHGCVQHREDFAEVVIDIWPAMPKLTIQGGHFEMFAWERRQITLAVINDTTVQVEEVRMFAEDNSTSALRSRKGSAWEVHAAGLMLQSPVVQFVSLEAGRLVIEILARPDLNEATLRIAYAQRSATCKLTFEVAPSVNVISASALPRDRLYSRDVLPAECDYQLKTLLEHRLPLLLIIDLDRPFDIEWRIEDIRMRTHTKRVVLPLRPAWVDATRPIPAVGMQQYVVSQTSANELELFWYNEALHASLSATWSRGIVNTRAIRMSHEMLQRYKQLYRVDIRGDRESLHVEISALAACRLRLPIKTTLRLLGSRILETELLRGQSRTFDFDFLPGAGHFAIGDAHFEVG